MASVVHFPSYGERSWRELLPAFQALMIETGVSQAAREWILDDMKPRFLELANISGDIDVQMLSDECRAAVESCIEQAIGITREGLTGAVQQMLILEADLYRAKFGTL